MNLLDIIERLTSLRGGSGDEGDVVTVMRAELQRLGASVHVDAMGNVYGRLGPGGHEFGLMLCVHTDEVGLIVRHIDDDGSLYFELNGTVCVPALPATPVDVCTEAGIVPGVIAARSSHLLNHQEMAQGARVEDLWIEIGARNAAQARMLGVRVGDNVVFRPNFHRLANGYFAGKSLDNRMGCAILLHLAEALVGRPLDYDLCLVASVQEEVGSRGAGVAARAVQPHLALVVDTVPAAEPLTSPRSGIPVVGGGPVLRAMDMLPSFLGTLYSPRIRRRLTATAERLGVPCQIDTAHTWTDAATIHAATGIPAGGVFIPRRGSHSPVEVACLADVEQAFRLVHAFLVELTARDIAALVAPPAGR